MKTGLNSPTISEVLARSPSPHSFPDTPPKNEIKKPQNFGEVTS